MGFFFNLFMRVVFGDIAPAFLYIGARDVQARIERLAREGGEDAALKSRMTEEAIRVAVEKRKEQIEKEARGTAFGGGGRQIKYYQTPKGTVTYRAEGAAPPAGSVEISKSQYSGQTAADVGKSWYIGVEGKAIEGKLPTEPIPIARAIGGEWQLPKSAAQLYALKEVSGKSQYEVRPELRGRVALITPEPAKFPTREERILETFSKQRALETEQRIAGTIERQIQAQTPTTRAEFAASLYKKLGYDVTKKGEQIIATKDKEQVTLAETGEVIARGRVTQVELRPEFKMISFPKQEKTIYFKEIAREIVKQPISFLGDIVTGASIIGQQALYIFGKTIPSPYTEIFTEEGRKIKIPISETLRVKKPLAKPEVKTFLFTAGFSLLPTKIATPLFTILTGKQIKETIATPTPEMVASSIWMGGLTTIGITPTISRIFTRLSPSYRAVETTSLGEKIIRKVPSISKEEIEIGLIPKGKTPPLKIDVQRLRTEALEKLRVSQQPTIPTTSELHGIILKATKEKGDTVIGSFAQRIFTGRGEYADIDIASKNIDSLATRIKQLAGNKVKIKDVKITDSPLGEFTIKRVIETKTGKIIADIDPSYYAEEGMLIKSKPLTIKGLKIEQPEIRLQAKIQQLARGKPSQKVPKQIDILTGRELKIEQRLKSPLIRGAFGYSQEEQAAYIGKKGIVTTAARDLFGLFKRSIITSKEGLYASPWEILTGRALVRPSRLALQREATFLDISKREFTFEPSKPQIIYFKGQVIGTDFKPFGSQRTRFSSELEVWLPPEKIIKKTKRTAVTLIEGKRVPIVEAEITKPSRRLIELLKKETPSTKELKELNSLYAKETRFEYSPKVTTKPYYSVSRPFISAIPSLLPKKSPIYKPSKKISQDILSIVVSYPPSAPPSITPSYPPSYPPSKPPKEKPRRFIKTYPLKYPIKEIAYNVLIKRKQLKKGKGSYISKGYTKANPEPLTREAALGLGVGIVDTYTNRSFTIKKAKGIPRPRPELEARWRALKHKIRQAKKKANIYVEKTAYAIDNPEEVRGIPYESLRLRRAGIIPYKKKQISARIQQLKQTKSQTLFLKQQIQKRQKISQNILAIKQQSAQSFFKPIGGQSIKWI